MVLMKTHGDGGYLKRKRFNVSMLKPLVESFVSAAITVGLEEVTGLK